MARPYRYEPLLSERVANIDGDIILYSCGYVADKEEGDEQHAIDLVDNMLLGFRDALQLSDCRIFLSDSKDNNFRYEVATTLPYKGNRAKQEKPKHYSVLKEHVISEWDAKIVKGAEADDGLGKAQTGTTLLCTIDKDLDMIQGWHYNWRKHTIYYVTREEAQYNFWMQMLTGDRTDNIQGIKGVGPKKAAKILEGIENEWLMYTAVHKAYCDEFGGMAGDRFYENHALLMIKGAPVSFGDPPPPSENKHTRFITEMA